VAPSNKLARLRSSPLTTAKICGIMVLVFLICPRRFLSSGLPMGRLGLVLGCRLAGLLRISEAAAIALHAACLLGTTPGELLTTAEIAKRLRVSETHLSKVMQRCVRARIAISVRGPGGGFRLSRDPSKITLLQVFEAVESRIEDQGCILNPPRCEPELCIFGMLGRQVNELVRSFLGSTRLSDVGAEEGKLIFQPGIDCVNRTS